MIIDEKRRKESIKVLGFDPYTKVYQALPIRDFSSKQCAYVLKYHNNDNRKIKPSQVNSISNSINEDGWLKDGGALTFNLEGNITEFQHRLEAIVREDITVPIPIILGVEPECFTKTAPPKARRPEDEIQRKYPDAKDSEITVVRQIQKRRGDKALNMQNATKYWKKWYKVVREGDKLIDGFFDRVDSFSHYRRNFAAWASLMHWYNQDKIVTLFLDMLEKQVLDDDGTRLTKDFMKMTQYTFDMSNSLRSDFVYYLLCVCSDRLIKSSDGRIQLDKTVGELDHNHLKQSGTYRQFLFNPDNIQQTGIILN
tara:strand:- start:825 stop:1757 length:933 start_codon:yes stop_codon:yes gene_type:complete